MAAIFDSAIFDGAIFDTGAGWYPGLDIRPIPRQAAARYRAAALIERERWGRIVARLLARARAVAFAEAEAFGPVRVRLPALVLSARRGIEIEPPVMMPRALKRPSRQELLRALLHI